MRNFSSYFLDKNWGHPANWLLAILFFSITSYIIGRGISQKEKQSLRLVVYAFSTQEEVLTQGIFPSFEQAWELENGGDLTIESVFGPSGTLVGQVNLGAPPDVAIFSNQRHVDWLKMGKMVREDTEPVLISKTPLVIITRQGNPKDITTYTDLTRPGLHLLHADPRNSGVGEWAVLAAFGSVFLEDGDQEAAKRELENIWGNVRLMGSSARSTLTLFELGAGDALITYEQDAFLAQQRGVPMEIIFPPRTILTQHYAVIVDKNVTPAERPIVKAFIAFILSDQGQDILSQYFFRPTTKESDIFPELPNTFTVDDLGGWAQAYKDLIEDYWKIQIEPFLEVESAAASLRVRE